MSAQEREKLPPNERRTLHRGRHIDAVTDGMGRRMTRIVDQGKSNGWRKEQYSQELVKLISQCREQLKKGAASLNKHVRPWAETNTKMGVK